MSLRAGSLVWFSPHGPPGGNCKVAGALSHRDNGGLAGWGAGTRKVPGANAWSSRWLAPGAG